VATPTINIVATPNRTSTTTSVGSPISAVPEDDIIVAVVNAGSTSSQGSYSVSSVTATGLTFTRRSAKYDSGVASGFQGTEVWWAPVPSGGFTGTVTATFDRTIDDATMHVFSVTDADTTNPWNDVSATTASNPSSSLTPPQVTFDAPADSLAIIAVGTDDDWSVSSPVSGFSILSTATNDSGVEYEHSSVVTQDLTGSGLSSATVGWTNNVEWWTLIADSMIGVGAAGVTVHESGTALLSFDAVLTVSALVAMSAVAGLDPNVIHAVPSGMVADTSMTVAGAFPRPVNDSFVTAYDLSGLGSGTVVGTNVNASTEEDEPTIANANTVWWKYTAATDGYMTFNTFGSIDLEGDVLDTVLSAYAGTAVDALTLLARSDDADDSTDSPAVTSEVVFRVEAGGTYHLQVETYDGDNPGVGTVMLTWAEDFGPDNDDFADAIALETPVGSIDGTTVGASTEATEPTSAEIVENSVWYRFIATQDGSYEFDISSPGGVVLETWTGTSIADIVFGDSVDSDGSITLSMLTGDVVYLRVGTVSVDDVAAFTLEWSSDALVAPANDDRANGYPLGTDSGSIAYYTAGATNESGEPQHLGEDPQSVWFIWTPGTLAAGLLVTDNATILEVYSVPVPGSDPATADWDELTPVGGGRGTATLALRVGEAYAIRAYPVDSNLPGYSQTLTWSVTSTGGGGGGDVPVGDILVTIPDVSDDGTIDSPDVIEALVVDESPGASIVITVDTDPTAILSDTIDDDGNWFGSVVIPEGLSQGDHYVLVSIGGRIGAAAFTVDSEVTYYEDPTDPADVAAPVIVGGQWVLP
jgi:hypothetical protein